MVAGLDKQATDAMNKINQQGQRSNSFSLGAGGMSSLAGGLSDIGSAAFAGNSRVANQSGTTQALNSAYDTTSSALMQSGNPYAMMAGAAMKVAGFASDALTAAGVGTDQMTGIDKVMDSKWLKLTPEGLVNASFAKSTDRFEKDAELEAAQGDAYADSYGDINAAVNHAGKKYGLFSSASRRKWQKEIQKQKMREEMISDINTENLDAQAAGNYEGLAIANQNRLNGGVSMLRAGKTGMKLGDNFTWAKRVVKASTGLQLNTFTPVKPEVDLNYDSVGNPFSSLNIPQLEERNPFMDWDMSLPTEQDDTDFLTKHQDTLTNLFNMEHLDHNSFMENLRTQTPGSAERYLYYMIKRQARNGNTTTEDILNKLHKQFRPSTVETMKQGGTFNVIPDGALHKNKHHMEDTEGLTQKGIPVVTEEEGKYVQQAEIEVNEIIFRLEVTQKLEELAKSGTDEAALEAGKLLTKEILHNTKDNTGLIDEIN